MGGSCAGAKARWRIAEDAVSLAAPRSKLGVSGERVEREFENVCGLVAKGRAREHLHSETVRPDIRPQLRELLAGYEEVLARIESGAVMAPGEQERMTEEASAVAHLLDLIDSSADEPAS